MPEGLLRSDGKEIPEARTTGDGKNTSDGEPGTERTLDDIIEAYARE